MATENEPKIRDRYCLECIYYQGSFEVSRCCCYYLITGKRRPCPGGNGCTVRVKRKRQVKTHLDYYKYEKKGNDGIC